MTKQKPKSKSPTARSLGFLRELGWIAQVVERWIQFPGMPRGVRQDLFGFIDIVAVHPEHRGVLAVQTTTFENRIARMRKVCAEPRALVWVQSGNRIEVHGWKKPKTGRWIPEIQQVTLRAPRAPKT